MPNHDAESADAALPVNDKTVRVFLENQAAFKGFLRRQLPSEEAAEDLLQQSLLKAIRDPEGSSGKENVTAWFYRILRNSLTDFYRSRAAEGRKHDGWLHELAASGGDSQPAPEDEMLQEICACMKRLLPSLKPEYGELIDRIDLAGEEPAAVAESAGITYNNLMVRLHRPGGPPEKPGKFLRSLHRTWMPGLLLRQGSWPHPPSSIDPRWQDPRRGALPELGLPDSAVRNDLAIRL